jgi:hypothetical protein
MPYQDDRYLSRNSAYSLIDPNSPRYLPEVAQDYQEMVKTGGFDDQYKRYPSETSWFRQYDNPSILTHRLTSPEEYKENVRIAYLLDRIGHDASAEGLRNPYQYEGYFTKGQPLANLVDYSQSGPSFVYNSALEMGNEVARKLGPEGMQDPYPNAMQNAKNSLNTFTGGMLEGTVLPKDTPSMFKANYDNNLKRNQMLDAQVKQGNELGPAKDYAEYQANQRSHVEDGYGFAKKMGMPEPLARLYGVVGDTLFDPFAATPASAFWAAPARAAAAAGTNKGLRYLINAVKEMAPDFLPEVAAYGIEEANN